MIRPAPMAPACMLAKKYLLVMSTQFWLFNRCQTFGNTLVNSVDGLLAIFGIFFEQDVYGNFLRRRCKNASRKRIAGLGL
jgi:hypothetical protein